MKPQHLVYNSAYLWEDWYVGLDTGLQFVQPCSRDADFESTEYLFREVCGIWSQQG